MKNYSAYWKEKIMAAGEDDCPEFCREAEPQQSTVFAFVVETQNNGPCFASAGVWYWTQDLNELASWIIEVQLRNIFSCCDEGRGIRETLEMTGMEYLQRIAEANGGEARANVLVLAQELQKSIDAGTLTFAAFSDWTARYSKLSERLPVMVEFTLFDSLDGAMALLREHEHSRGDEQTDPDLIVRFQEDYIC